MGLMCVGRVIAPDLLKFLDDKKLAATFFAVGSRVVSFPATLISEYMSGHDVAVHTWSHHVGYFEN